MQALAPTQVHPQSSEVICSCACQVQPMQGLFWMGWEVGSPGWGEGVQWVAWPVEWSLDAVIRSLPISGRRGPDSGCCKRLGFVLAVLWVQLQAALLGCLPAPCPALSCRVTISNGMRVGMRECRSTEISHPMCIESCCLGQTTCSSHLQYCWRVAVALQHFTQKSFQELNLEPCVLCLIYGFISP